jgi:signal transduction histidine kinase
VSFLTNSLAVRLFGELLIANADALDRARAERVEQGERLARQQERVSHQRLVHDSALQLLEALAGGWEVDGEQLLDRIDVELAALGSLGTATGTPEVLAVSMVDLVDRAATDGLEVIAQLDDVAQAFVGPGAVALAAAVGEALTNVRKHSGVRVASLVVQTDGVRIVATVIDEGRGFDPQFLTGGFGLRNSIEDRLAEVGGAAAIRSVPGQGTTVEMWVPR